MRGLRRGAWAFRSAAEGMLVRRERLGGLRAGSQVIRAHSSALVRQSNVLTAQVLAHLVEVEQRMLHLELRGIARGSFSAP